MTGLLGSLSQEDRGLGLLNLGAGMLAGNQGRTKGQAFQNAIGAGVGNYTNTLALLGRQQLARDESSQREGIRKAQEEALRQQAMARQAQMQAQQHLGQLASRIGQPKSMMTPEQVYSVEDFVRDAAPIPGGLEFVQKYMGAQPQYDIRQGVGPDGRPMEQYVPKQPGVGAPRPTGNTPYQKELDPAIRGAAINDRVAMETALNPLMMNRAAAGRSINVNQNFPARADFKDERAFSKEYQDASGTFTKLSEGYQKVKRALGADPTKSAPATLAGATQFMKMLDPESVVRESELAMALNSTGMMDQFLNLHNRVLSGKVLTPKQVEEIGKVADIIYGAAEEGQARRFENYRKSATQYGFDVERTIPDLRPKMMPKPGSKPSMLPKGVTVTPMDE